MRKRKEIEDQSKIGNTTGYNGGADEAPGINTKLIIEVLLDIRDLLTKFFVSQELKK